jgi:hypothetical protein
MRRLKLHRTYHETLFTLVMLSFTCLLWSNDEFWYVMSWAMWWKELWFTISGTPIQRNEAEVFVSYPRTEMIFYSKFSQQSGCTSVSFALIYTAKHNICSIATDPCLLTIYYKHLLRLIEEITTPGLLTIWLKFTGNYMYCIHFPLRRPTVPYVWLLANYFHSPQKFER